MEHGVSPTEPIRTQVGFLLLLAHPERHALESAQNLTR